MQCLTPIHVVNNKDPAKGVLTVPCGKCPACSENKAAQWYVRLKSEAEVSENCVFVTYTYNDLSLPEPRKDEAGFYHYDVSRYDVQHLHYRIRKSLGYRSRKLKYFLVSEYGPNPINGWLFRPHYHAIYFNLMPDDYYIVEKAWNKGFTEISQVTDDRIRYVSGYSIEKLFVPPGAAPSFSLISNGIGQSYVEKMKSFHKGNSDRMLAYVDGKRYPLPRYLKERLYNETERAAFAKVCELKGEQQYEKDLAACGGDQNMLMERYREIRSDYLRKRLQKHKKRKN